MCVQVCVCTDVMVTSQASSVYLSVAHAVFLSLSSSVFGFRVSCCIPKK